MSRTRNYSRRSKKYNPKPRALRPSQFLDKWRSFEQKNIELNRAVTEQTEALSASSDSFFEQIVGFKPYRYQKEFIDIFEANQFTAARWCRQSGKTQTV